MVLISNSNFTQQGIVFSRGSETYPTGFSNGHFNFVQTINRTATTTFRDSNPLTIITESGLDGCYPYGLSESAVTDNPSAILDATGFLTQNFEYDADWVMYVMFKPNGSDSVWVPLFKVIWAWDATTTYSTNPTGHYEATGIVEPATNKSIATTTDFPSWISVVTDPNGCTQ